MTGRLDARRVMVVGASAGIGRATANAAIREGAETAFVARRAEKLREAVEEAGGGSVVVGDVRHEDECARIVGEAVDALGGPFDLVVYAAGVSPLVRTEALTRADWLRALDVNTIGASLLIGACLPHMAGHGMVAYLSSESIGMPRHGGIVYQASKAAMEEALHVFRAEHPAVRFVNVVVGATVGTEIAVDRDLALMAELAAEWVRRGLLRGGFMEATALGSLLIDMLVPVLDYPSADMTQLTLTATGPILDDIASIMSNQADVRQRATGC